MSTPSQPTFQREGPASPCTLHGHNLTWKNCTTLSAGMAIDKSTLGRIVLSGCAIRDETGDYVGGTTLVQMQAVATAHGVKTELHVGANVCSPFYAAYQCAAGRGFILQGNCAPDGRGNVNHAVWINAAQGKAGDPSACHVYDPWSSGPAWWTWAKVRAFAAALHPWGEDDRRVLGPGKFYALVFPDSEPHVHLHYGAGRTSPFPDRMTAHSPAPGRRVNVRSRPDRLNPADITGTLRDGTVLAMYQVTHAGAKPPGSLSATWFGSHDGNRWVHSSGVAGAGGTA